LAIVSSGATGEKYITSGGSKSNEIEVLIDGRSINSILTGKADLGQIPVNSITKIEYSQAGNEYNSGKPGLGGTVNLITASTPSSETMSLSVTRGSYTLENYTASINSSLNENKHIRFSANYRHIKNNFGYKDYYGENQDRRNAFGAYSNIYLSYNQNSDKDNLKLSAYHYSGNNGVPGRIIDPSFEAVSDKETFSAGGDYQLLINPKLTLANSISYRSEAYIYTDSTTFSLFNSEYKENEFEYSLKGILAPVSDFEIVALVSQNRTTLDGNDKIRPAYSLGKFTRNLSRFYTAVSGSQKYGRFESSIGVSHSENYTDAKSYSSSNLTSNLRLNSKLVIDLQGTLARSFRLPGLAELNWKEDVFTLPAPDLKPEKSTLSSVTLSANTKIGGNLRISFGYSDKNYNDLIYWRRSEGVKYKAQNVSKSNYYTTTFTSSYHGLDGFLDIAYSREDITAFNREANSQLNGKFIIHQPEYINHLNLKLNIYDISFGVEMIDSGSRFFIEDNTKELPPYTLLGCRIDYRFDLAKLNVGLTLRIENLTDIEYQLLEYQPMPPRSLRLRVQLKI